MTSIPPHTPAIASLQRRIADDLRRDAATRATGVPAAPAPSSGTTPDASAVALPTAIDPAHPDAPLQAFRAHLAARIRSELGGIDATDACLGAVLDRVWHEMRADAALADAMSAAGRELLAAADRPR